MKGETIHLMDDFSREMDVEMNSETIHLIRDFPPQLLSRAPIKMNLSRRI